MPGKTCEKGEIKRKAYTANRKGKTVKVKSACIKATSASGSKRSTRDRAYLAKRAKIQEKMGEKYGSKSCKTGQIERAGFTKRAFQRKSYVRKDGTKVRGTYVKTMQVAPVCVKDTGAREKEYSKFRLTYKSWSQKSRI